MDRRAFIIAAVSGAASAACQNALTPVETCDVADRGGEAGGGTTLTPEDFESTGGCAMTPEDILGPYYVCVQSYRSSIAEDRPGRALRLGFRVVDASCQPIRDAVVDVWHCDADGNYSAFDADPDIPAGESQVNATDTRFCRGAQSTNADGIAEFQTIFPGWYAGRTTHVHVRVYLPDGRQFTTQTYFSEEVRDLVYGQGPYDAARAAAYPTNAEESVSSSMTMNVTGDDELTATILLTT